MPSRHSGDQAHKVEFFPHCIITKGASVRTAYLLGHDVCGPDVFFEQVQDGLTTNPTTDIELPYGPQALPTRGESRPEAAGE